MKINKAGIDLIKQYESLHDGNLNKIGLQPKLCPAGIWTEGYGRAMIGKDGKFLTSKNTTKAQAESLATIHNEADAINALNEDIEQFSNKIKPLLKVVLNENQFSACVSLAYNIGANAFNNSSVLRYINLNKFNHAADSFLLWNRATINGVRKELRGLTNRRNAERELFLTKN
jgi:lysozyme